MSALERPQLRPHLAAAPEGRGGFVIWDPLRLADRSLRVTHLEMAWLRLLDGRHTLDDIRAEVLARLDGQTPPREAFARLVEKLDHALFLDSPRFRSRLHAYAANP